MNTHPLVELIALLPQEARVEMLPPVTGEQIDQASAAIGKRLGDPFLPAEIETVYRTCGGQRWETPTEHFLFPSFTINPIERAISDYEEMCNLYEINVLPDETQTLEFPKTWYDFRLFPFGTSFGTGTLYCIATHTGQIFSFNPDGGIHVCEYDSFEDLIEKSLRFQQDEYGR